MSIKKKKNSKLLNRFLVTGSNGMIGSQIPWGIKSTRKDFDLRDFKSVSSFLKKKKPAGILHLAGLDIRSCKNDLISAFQVNVLALKPLIEYCRKNKKPLIFVSSGAVFYGSKEKVFYETDTLNPVNIYGLTKQLAEEFISVSLKNFAIIRTGWVFGGNAAHQKKFVEMVIEAARGNGKIQASTDQWGSPTYVLDLISAIEQVIQRKLKGTIHIANSGKATAFDIAQAIKTDLGSSLDIQTFEALGNSELKRSPSEVLGTKRLKLRSWQEALKDYLRKS
ncbi:MAG: NAD(P)-dependent oxidoreductase [Bacteriovoracia bacterium]